MTPANTVGFELKYNFIDSDTHSINYFTRNSCSLAQVKIISLIIKTLYPEEHFSILSLPPEEGSFKDLVVVKFLNNNPGALTALGLLLPALLYSSQFQVNRTTSDFNTLQIIEKCEELGLDLTSVYKQKIQDLCNSYNSKKEKNIFYESILSNKDVTSIKPTISNNEEKIFETEIVRDDFAKYIEEIPREKEYLKTDLSGNIQLSQPFIVKQQQHGRGIPWKGIYYGDDVFDENGELIVADGENIFFYMQDDDYKNQILNQEISFTSGDNIGVIFDISRYYDYINNRYGKPRLYVKRVVSHNDNLVQRKKELELKRKRLREENSNQASLFSDVED